MSVEPLRLLISYAYLDQIRGEMEAAGNEFDWVLDSGAFTAWRQGKRVDLDAYCDAVTSFAHPPSYYFMLDEIGDADQTRRNYEAMLSRGLRPVPVFTRGESLDHLDAYFETSDIVAVGSLVRTVAASGFTKAVMERAQGRRIHWLGYSNGPMMARYRPFAVDASSWVAGLRYGTIKLHIGQGRFRQLGRSDFASKPRPEVCAALERIGVDPRRLAFSAEWRNPTDPGAWSALQEVSYRGWIEYQRALYAAIGTRLYLVVGFGGQVDRMIEADAWLRKHTAEGAA